jgi:hypothetical protein
MIVVYMKEAEPSSPEEAPLQESLKRSQRLLKGDSTRWRDNRKFHDSDIAWPKDGAGFYQSTLEEGANWNEDFSNVKMPSRKRRELERSIETL